MVEYKAAFLLCQIGSMAVPLQRSVFNANNSRRSPSMSRKKVKEWAVILATLSNLEGMSTEKLLDFWRKMDQVSTRRLMEHKPKWWKVKSVPI